MALEHFGTISANKRAIASKGSMKKARQNGEILAVLYGKKEGHNNHSNGHSNNKNGNILLSVHENTFSKIIADQSVMMRIFSLKIDNKAHSVIIKSIQCHPVTGRPIHIDFLEVDKESTVKCFIPIYAVNQEECEQIKRGGIIVMLNNVALIAGPVAKIPEAVKIDVAHLQIGNIVFGKDYKLPDGCKFQRSNLPLVKMIGKRSPKEEAKTEDKTNTASPPPPATEGKGK